MPADVSDSQLARLVKEENSNEAMTEIIARHTGIYLSVVNSFSIPPLQKNDLLDSKNTNIYKYTLKYDDTQEMKLSSYLHQRTYFDCLRTLGKITKTEELQPDAFSESFTYNDEESVKNVALKTAREIGGHEFEKVIGARHFGDKTGKLSWHRIPDLIGGSHERARIIYFAHIEKFKEEMKKQFDYVIF